MAVRPITIYGHPILRQNTRPVENIDDALHTLVDDMIETMRAADGIGLAAPQVSESVRVCVVNMELVEEANEASPKAFVNPEILASDGTSTMEEGCLSIPDIREEVQRPERIRVRYQDLEGKQHEEEIDGLLARVLQHEIDHLDGVLFVDRMPQVKRKLLSKKLKKLADGENLVYMTSESNDLS